MFGVQKRIPSVLQFKKVDCKNCYKCVRYCPVKAIRIKNHQAQIIESQCILCEKCTVVCPQSAKVELNMIPDIMREIQAGTQMIASVHPAFLAKFELGGFDQFALALKKLGFCDAFEAAEGAYLVKKEYEKFLENRACTKMTIASTCPVIVQLIEKHYPHLVEYMAPLLTMMQAHGAYLKQKYPDKKIVYISPCMSSMAEMTEESNYVDYVITFQELNEYMEEQGLILKKKDSDMDRYLSRITALPDGMIQAMQPVPQQKYLSIHGMENCQRVLDELDGEGYENCFLELSACLNGCIGGPSFHKGERKLLDTMIYIRNASLEHGVPNYELDYNIESDVSLERKFGNYISQKEAAVSEDRIREILAEMGKFTEKDELNCGACGYNTCREKAIAISENKAEVAMCVPYMRAKQENYSKKIINAMPGLLVTVDYNLNVVQMNKAAMDLFDVTRKKQLMGVQVSSFMDDFNFANMISFEKNYAEDQIYLENEKIYLSRLFTNDKQNKLIICIMKNITKEIKDREAVRDSQLAAARIADRLVEEQLKIVHQIAGMLGETAADTKIAVEELKNTILQENGKEDEKKNKIWSERPF